MVFNVNILTLKIVTIYNYKICGSVKNILAPFDQIQQLNSAIRVKHCGVKLENCIPIDELWKLSKNVVILNDCKKSIKDVKFWAIGEFVFWHKGCDVTR